MLARKATVIRQSLPKVFLGSISQFTPSYATRTFYTSSIINGRRSAKIANRKGKSDAIKAKIYGKMGKQIAAAVRAGGADIIANSRLQLALQQAKLANVPNEIIDRNMKKAADKNSADYTEVVYEAYGPGGTGFIMECLTDNLNRTAADVRTAVVKANGKMADPGSVLFNFARTGCIQVKGSEGEDRVFEAAMDAGATDIQSGPPAPSTDNDSTSSTTNPEYFKVLTSVEDFAAVANNLRERGLVINEEACGLVYMPLNGLDVDDDDVYEANEAMLERILGVDDVDAVFSNVVGLGE